MRQRRNYACKKKELSPHGIGNLKFGKKTLEPAYVDEMNLWDSILKVLSSSNLEIQIEVLEFTGRDHQLSHLNKSQKKRELAEKIREKISSKI